MQQTHSLQSTVNNNTVRKDAAPWKAKALLERSRVTSVESRPQIRNDRNEYSSLPLQAPYQDFICSSDHQYNKSQAPISSWIAQHSLTNSLSRVLKMLPTTSATSERMLHTHTPASGGSTCSTVHPLNIDGSSFYQNLNDVQLDTAANTPPVNDSEKSTEAFAFSNVEQETSCKEGFLNNDDYPNHLLRESVSHFGNNASILCPGPTVVTPYKTYGPSTPSPVIRQAHSRTPSPLNLMDITGCDRPETFDNFVPPNKPFSLVYPEFLTTCEHQPVENSHSFCAPYLSDSVTSDNTPFELNRPITLPSHLLDFIFFNTDDSTWNTNTRGGNCLSVDVNGTPLSSTSTLGNFLSSPDKKVNDGLNLSQGLGFLHSDFVINGNYEDHTKLTTLENLDKSSYQQKDKNFQLLSSIGISQNNESLEHASSYLASLQSTTDCGWTGSLLNYCSQSSLELSSIDCKPLSSQGDSHFHSTSVDDREFLLSLPSEGNQYNFGSPSTLPHMIDQNSSDSVFNVVNPSQGGSSLIVESTNLTATYSNIQHKSTLSDKSCKTSPQMHPITSPSSSSSSNFSTQTTPPTSCLNFPFFDTGNMKVQGNHPKYVSHGGIPAEPPVGGRHFSAPIVLAHPEEFKNPSSFLKVYGDPLCTRHDHLDHIGKGQTMGMIRGKNGNWICHRCCNVNYPRRFRCNKCNEMRNSQGDLIVSEYVLLVYEQHLKTYRKLPSFHQKNHHHQHRSTDITNEMVMHIGSSIKTSPIIKKTSSIHYTLDNEPTHMMRENKMISSSPFVDYDKQSSPPPPPENKKIYQETTSSTLPGCSPLTFSMENNYMQSHHNPRELSSTMHHINCHFPIPKKKHNSFIKKGSTFTTHSNESISANFYH